MSTIPTAALAAAVDATTRAARLIRSTNESIALAAVGAAMPAIRQALALEVVGMQAPHILSDDAARAYRLALEDAADRLRVDA